jgi:uncharacterized protein YsxB (DUF464 family)
MNTFTIVRDNNGKVIKYYGHGHTGYAEHGEDIVCASISAVSQQTALGILNVLNIPVHVSTNAEDGFLLVDIMKKQENSSISSDEYNQLLIQNREKIDVLVETMVVMLREIEKQYPEYLKIIEKEDK